MVCSPTYLQWFVVSVIIKWSEQSPEHITAIGLDNFNVCKDMDRQPNIYTVDEGNTLIAVAKSVDHLSASNVRNCLIRVQPDTSSKLQLLRIVFESFYIKTCDVTLTFEEISFQSFEEDVRVLSKLSCKDLSPVVLTTSKAGNTIQVNLTRTHSQRDFNFRLNITAFNFEKSNTQNLSLGEKIGIAVICSVAGIILLILIYKTIRLRISVNKDKRQEESTSLQLQEHRTGNGPSVIAQTPSPEDDENMQVTIIHASEDGPLPSNPLPEDSTYATLSDSNDRDTYIDAPPSYDEALSMPLPASSGGHDSPEYQNLPASNPSKENGALH